jgi:hypothetical protein
MQGMSSDVQVRVQCWVCFHHCWAAARSLLAQHVGNMLYGMQGMSSDVPEVRSVLGMLPRLFSCKEPLKGQTVEYAVRNAGHEQRCSGVRSVLGMLPRLLGSCREPLKAQRRWAICCTVYGA